MLNKNMELFKDRNLQFIIITMICICIFTATPVKAEVPKMQIVQGITVSTYSSIIEDNDEVYASLTKDNSSLIAEWNNVIASIRTEYWDYNEELALQAMHYFIDEQGLSKYGAAGIVGNIYAECGFDASAGSYYLGICQWDCVTRWPRIVNWLRNNGWNDYSFEGQLRAIFYSSDADYFTWVFDEMKTITNEKEAAIYWLYNYEVAPGQAEYKRQQGATYALALYEIENL